MKSGVFALLVAALAVPISPTAQSGIPDELFSESGERLWLGGDKLAATFALGSRGELRAGERTKLDWFLEHDAGESGVGDSSNPLDCLDFSVLDMQLSRARSAGQANLWATIREAGLVAVGTVAGRGAGLLDSGLPYEMLVVRVDEWVKEGKSNRIETVYVPYPATYLSIAGRSVCSPHMRRVPPAPEVGARVLLVRWPREFDPRMSPAAVPIMFPYVVLYETAGRLFLYDDFAEETPGWDRMSFAQVVERARRIGDEKSSTPLAIGVNGNWLPWSTSLYEDPVRFDIDADGELEATAWLGFDSAFLWLDLNDNETVDDASEFFGSSSVDLRGEAFEADNGFDVLAAYDRPEYGGNADGRIDRSDRIWRRLRTWEDRDRDGVSQPHEIAYVRDYPRVSHFLTEYRLVGRLDGSINELIARSLFFVEGPGGGLRQREVRDFDFRYNDEN